MNKLKAIKIIVFALTFLLIMGTLTALSLVVKKSGRSIEAIKKEVYLGQPSGSEIDSITHNDNKTFILINGGAEDRIVVLDSTNNIISTIYINEAKK